MGRTKNPIPKKVPREKSAGYLFPHLVEEWNENNERSIFEVRPGSNKKVWWVCSVNPEHEWKSTIYHRTKGSGCPRCAKQISKGETALGDFLESLGYEVVRNSRKLIPPKEIDLFIPSLGIAFEYNGDYWHSSKYKEDDYHENKTQLALEKVITLYRVWEYDWTYYREQQEIWIKEVLENRRT